MINTLPHLTFLTTQRTGIFKPILYMRAKGQKEVIFPWPSNPWDFNQDVSPSHGLALTAPLYQWTFKCPHPLASLPVSSFPEQLANALTCSYSRVHTLSTLA